MKFLVIIAVVLLLFSCNTEADKLRQKKNVEAETTGLSRKVTAYSTYTGQVIFERAMKNSYFEAARSGGYDILDLKTGLKTSIRGEGYTLVIDELAE